MTSPAVRQTPQPLQCPVNDLQLRSSFFGKLPAEIRQQIYDECWLASGPQQHVLLRQGRHSPLGGGLTHFPCCKTPGDESEMLSEHDGIVENQRQSRSRSSAFLVDETWLSRFSSPWLDHWRCEEALREEDLVRDFERSSGVTPRQRTLFLPMLLCCRRMYQESLISIYTNTAFVYTDLTAARRAFVSAPTPTTPLVQSLDFSMALPYDVLHEHKYYSSPESSAGPWTELCVALSDMARFNSLKTASLRLDLADGSTRPIETSPAYLDGRSGNGSDSPTSDCFSTAGSAASGVTAAGPGPETRFWWQVRERWVLSPIRGILARRLTVHLPERRRETGLRSTAESSRPSRMARSFSLSSSVSASSASTSSADAETGHIIGRVTEPTEDHDDTPEWLHKYQYRDGDRTPFVLQRYRKCRLPQGGVVVHRSCPDSGPPSPRSLFKSWATSGASDGSAGPSSPVHSTYLAATAGDGRVEGIARRAVQQGLRVLMKGRAKE